tara:strand:+ start:157 stop:336 length:180 start_codon:yes stop_codon:yes gene_type:complete
MTINIELKTHYGQQHIYVVDEVEAKAISQLTGKKTISKNDIAALETLGVYVNVVTPELI